MESNHCFWLLGFRILVKVRVHQSLPLVPFVSAVQQSAIAVIVVLLSFSDDFFVAAIFVSLVWFARGPVTYLETKKLQFDV